jgi:hypothetical protein
MGFYPNQTDDAVQILQALLTCAYVVLCAQMQSGKTGTFLYSACKWAYEGKPVVIVTASRSKELIKQYTKDKKEAIEWFAKEMSNGDIDHFLETQEKLDKGIQIYFGQDLKRIKKIDDNTLIIHDESHYGQSKSQTLNKRFENLGIAGVLSGDFSVLRQKNIRYVSVSATPFSELNMNAADSQGKVIIMGTPGDGYISVGKLLEEGKIHFNAVPFKEAHKFEIRDILANYVQINKYVIVRTHRSEKDEPLVREIAELSGFEYTSVFGGPDSGGFDFLEEAPQNPTIVHICGKARMGNQLEKGHISMCYEQSANAKTDTILQGLLGRMCGYYDRSVMPDVFVSPKCSEEVHKYVDAWNGETQKLAGIRKATNVFSGRTRSSGVIQTDKDGGKWIATLVSKVLGSEIDIGNGESRKVSVNDIRNVLADKRRTDAEEKIHQYLRPGRNEFYTRKIKAYTSLKDRLDKAFNEGKRYAPFNDVIGTHTIHHIQKKRYSLIGPNKWKRSGVWYIVGFERYNVEEHGEIQEELPKVAEKCNYHPAQITAEDGTVVENVNGGQTIHFPFSTSKNTKDFYRNLQNAIRRTIPGDRKYIEGCQTSIQSIHDNGTKEYKGIFLSKDVYTKSVLNELDTYYKKLERHYKIKIKVNKKRGRPSKGEENYIRYTSISWTLLHR